MKSGSFPLVKLIGGEFGITRKESFKYKEDTIYGQLTQFSSSYLMDDCIGLGAFSRRKELKKRVES